MAHGNKTMPLDRYPYFDNDLKSNRDSGELVERVIALEEKQKTKWYVLSSEDKNVIFDTLNEDIVSFSSATIKICGNVVQLYIKLLLNRDFQKNTFLSNIGKLNRDFYDKTYLVLKSYYVHMKVRDTAICDLFNWGDDLLPPKPNAGFLVYDTYILTDEEITILHNILKNYIYKGG